MFGNQWIVILQHHFFLIKKVCVNELKIYGCFEFVYILFLH